MLSGAVAMAGCAEDQSGSQAGPGPRETVTLPNGTILQVPAPPTSEAASASNDCGRNGAPPAPGLRARLVGSEVRFEYDAGDPPKECRARFLRLAVSYPRGGGGPLIKDVTLNSPRGTAAIHLRPSVEFPRGSVARATAHTAANDQRGASSEVLLTGARPGTQPRPPTGPLARGSAAYNDLCVIKLRGQPLRLERPGVVARLIDARRVVVSLSGPVPPRCPPRSIRLRLDDPSDRLPAVTKQFRMGDVSEQVTLLLPGKAPLGRRASVTGVVVSANERPSLTTKAQVFR